MKPPIMEAKLRPTANGKLLERERLLKDLKGNLSKRLFLMVSYAGSGKSTLAAQLVQSQSLDSIWYALDSHDQDPAVFFHYLKTALRERHSGFCRGIEPHALQSSTIWPRFIQELQSQTSRPLFLVLDNYECVRGVKLINQFLIYLLQHLPPTLHLVILASQPPRFSLTRFRLTNDLYELRPHDLAFTVDEAHRLFETVFDLPIPQSTVSRMVQETEGWALAIVLYAQNMRMRKVSKRNSLMELREICKEELYEYFMEEILKSLPPHVQDLLKASALLSFVSPDELKGFMGPKNARILLKRLADSDLPMLMINGGTGTCRYHGLFRDFLLHKLQAQKSESEIADLHLRAAASLKKTYPVEAIEHYLHAGQTGEASALLEDLGWGLLREGRYETLRHLLNGIPMERCDQNPVLLYYAGRIREVHGHAEAAQEHYQKALNGLSDNAVNAQAACRQRLGILELKKDHFVQASRILHHTLNQLEGSEIRKDLVRRLIATHSNLAKVYCKLEEENRTSHHLNKAQALFDSYGEPADEIIFLQAKTLECMAKGRFEETVLMGGKGKDLCQESGYEGLIPLFDHYLAFAHLHMGNFKEAQGLAVEGLSILEKQGVEDNVSGALFSVFGHCQMTAEQIPQGIQSLKESSRIFKKTQNFCGQFWNDSALCLSAVRQNDLSSAWDYWRMMERNSRRLSLPMQHAMALTVEAYLSALEQTADKVMERIHEAAPYLRRTHQQMSVFHALILTIKSYITIGRHDLAEETLLDAVAAGNEVRFYYPIHYELAWFAPFVDRLVRKNPHLKSIWPARPEKKGEEALVLASCSHPLPHSCVSDDANLLDLHVCSFGPFEITANGWKVPLDQCPSKKALTLIKYLFFKRHEGGVSLDEALELLWPEMDPRATRANLRVILSMLRKVFKGTGNGENGLPNLIREDNKISLLLGKSGWADVDEFLGQIRLAGYKEKRGLWEEALIHHEKTVELYRGDFLAEELYADWCYMEREYLRDRFLASLIRMAEGHERLGNYTEAISVLYRALKTDKYREDAYRKLMVLCAKADRKGEIIRVYELCKKAIEDDLNLELSTDTESLYLKLSSNSVDVDLPLHAKQIVFPS